MLPDTRKYVPSRSHSLIAWINSLGWQSGHSPPLLLASRFEDFEDGALLCEIAKRLLEHASKACERFEGDGRIGYLKPESIRRAFFAVRMMYSEKPRTKTEANANFYALLESIKALASATHGDDPPEDYRSLLLGLKEIFVSGEITASVQDREQTITSIMQLLKESSEMLEVEHGNGLTQQCFEYYKKNDTEPKARRISSYSPKSTEISLKVDILDHAQDDSIVKHSGSRSAREFRDTNSTRDCMVQTIRCSQTSNHTLTEDVDDPLELVINALRNALKLRNRQGGEECFTLSWLLCPYILPFLFDQFSGSEALFDESILPTILMGEVNSKLSLIFSNGVLLSALVLKLENFAGNTRLSCVEKELRSTDQQKPKKLWVLRGINLQPKTHAAKMNNVSIALRVLRDQRRVNSRSVFCSSGIVSGNPETLIWDLLKDIRDAYKKFERCMQSAHKTRCINLKSSQEIFARKQYLVDDRLAFHEANMDRALLVPGGLNAETLYSTRTDYQENKIQLCSLTGLESNGWKAELLSWLTTLDIPHMNYDGISVDNAYRSVRIASVRTNFFSHFFHSLCKSIGMNFWQNSDILADRVSRGTKAKAGVFKIMHRIVSTSRILAELSENRFFREKRQRLLGMLEIEPESRLTSDQETFWKLIQAFFDVFVGVHDRSSTTDTHINTGCDLNTIYESFRTTPLTIRKRKPVSVSNFRAVRSDDADIRLARERETNSDPKPCLSEVDLRVEKTSKNLHLNNVNLCDLEYRRDIVPHIRDKDNQLFSENEDVQIDPSRSLGSRTNSKGIRCLSRVDVDRIIEWLVVDLGIDLEEPERLHDVLGFAPEWSDGTLLCKLVDRLGFSRSDLRGVDRTPKTRASSVQNIRLALSALGENARMSRKMLNSYTDLASGRVSTLLFLLHQTQKAFCV